MDRVALLFTAISAGGLYAALRVLVVVFYPAVASYLWQFLVGPLIMRRWPTAAQGDDKWRPSYIPANAEHPFVIRWSRASFVDVAQGLRDGLLLGIYVALAPELVALSLTVLAAIPLVRGGWRMSRAHGAARTDAAFDAFGDFLLYVAVIQAITLAGLLQVRP